MPEATATPSRSLSSPESSRPASAQASRAATTANCAVRSRRRALTRSMTSVGSTAAGAAIWQARFCTQSSVSRLAPERPASSPSQVLDTSPPSGVVAPSPVITTRVFDILVPHPSRESWGVRGVGRADVVLTKGSGEHPRPAQVRAWSAVLGALDERDRVADGLQVLDLVVGDLHVELLLGGHHDLHHGERVDVEVVGEGLVQLDVLHRDAGDLVHDLGEVGTDLFGAGHLLGFPFGVAWLLQPGRPRRPPRTTMDYGSLITW